VDLETGSGRESVDLPGDGHVTATTVGGVGLFRLERPNGASDARFYSDSRASMDLLLKALKLPRMVGTQAVRVTSLGAAASDSGYTDSFGRKWQLRQWSLGFADAHVLLLSLPVPDGYVGMFQLAMPPLLETNIEQLKLLADYFYVSYSGSLPQWSAFMSRHELRPAVFDQVKVDYDYTKGLRYTSPRLEVNVTPDVMSIGDRSSLSLDMAYSLEGDHVTWAPSSVSLKQDRDKKTYVAAYRQAKPDAGAGKDALEHWNKMSKREGEFRGTPGHENEMKVFWIHLVADAEKSVAQSAAGSGTLYELIYSTDAEMVPRQFFEIAPKLTRAFRVMER
jgi:hypothetical protein